MFLRVVATIWAIACVFVALDAALGMLITFAPSEGRVGALAAAELAGIERVRRVWWGSIWMCAGMLIVNSAAIVVVLWRRRTGK
jgi:hypothetical protein